MITHTLSTWSDFKTEVTNRSMWPQWVDENGSYYIYAQDGFIYFKYELKQDSGADQTDFETNYKTIWNARLDYRDPHGLMRVHTSPRKEGTTTYFAGAGDNGGVGSGTRLLFNMLAGTASKSKDVQFNEAVYIKDGIIIAQNAPLGSSIDVEVYDPLDNLVVRFAKTFNLLGTQVIYLNSEDSEELTSIVKMRITVNNSVEGAEENESPKAFKVVGNIEMYRSNTL